MALLSRGVGGWYRIVATLGRGGMADVYQCAIVRFEGPPLSVQFAVKVLREAWDPENLFRFREEARLLRGLRHPNLVPAIEIHLEHNPPYYVMPVMKETLEKRLAEMRRRGQLYRAKHAFENIIMPLCSAAQYLHSRRIFHRDIKPANIFLDAAGTPRLGDLSICHRSRPFPIELTWCGMGTQGYTAPETLETGIATAQSDIYSLGVILYEILTGNPPRHLWWVRGEDRPSVQHPRSCHRDVDQLLVNMTHPNPEMRYRAVSQVTRDIHFIVRVDLPRLAAYQPPRLRVLPPASPASQGPSYGFGALIGSLASRPARPAYAPRSLAALLPPAPAESPHQPRSLGALIAMLARK